VIYLKNLKSVIPIVFIMVLACVSHGRSLVDLEIAVYTDKPLYDIEDDIEIYGSLTADGFPVENETVALEVRDPTNSPVIVRTLQTNSSGDYNTIFKLSLESQLGTYTIHANSNHEGVTATDTTSFEVGGESVLSLTVETSRQSYDFEETIEVNGLITLDSQPIQGVLVAVEVQDPLNTSVIVRVLETKVDGSFLLTFQMSTDAANGTYTVHASSNCAGQTATADTTFQLQPQQLSADLNGDGVVNILDISLIAIAWGSYPGHPRWDPKCDLDGNNVINIIDITLVAIAYNP